MTSIVGISVSSAPSANATGVDVTVTSNSISFVNQNSWTSYGADNISVSGSGDVRVFIQAINAVLKVTKSGTITDLTGYSASNSAGGASEIAFSGSLTDVNATLDSLQYSASTSSASIKFVAVANSDGVFYNFTTGHLYKYVSGTINWANSMCQAAYGSNSSSLSAQNTEPFVNTCASTSQISLLGLSAYLATITTAAERTFLVDRVTSTQNVWIAGSDHTNENYWYWRAGPESGQLFYVDNGSSGTDQTYADSTGQNTTWSNFTSGEPNSAEQDALIANWTAALGWDDQSVIGDTNSGYLREYGTTGQTITSLESVTLTQDSAAPTASLTTSETSPNTPKTLTYTLTFSEAITGLTSSDLSNGSSSSAATGCSFAVSAVSTSVYTITVSSCSVGNVTPRLASGSVTDLATNTGPTSNTDGTTINLIAACVTTDSQADGYQIRKFTSVGNCLWTLPEGASTSDVLVVGGGGGGGADGGSGGSGGELRTATSYSFSGITKLEIVVGSGGLGGTWGTLAGSGSSSFIKKTDTSVLFEAKPGQNGLGWTVQTVIAGGSGGSGGDSVSGQNGGLGPTNCDATSEGSGTYTLGSSPSGTTPSNSITGSTVSYGGGGGGGSGYNLISTETAKTGVAGGGTNSGGRGANYKIGLDGSTITGASAGQAGFANTGGGGGGGAACDAVVSNSTDSAAYNAANGVSQRTAGGNGGSGIVVIRYQLPVEAPSAPNLTDASDSGSSNSDNLTKNTTLTFTGTNMAGASVALFVGVSSNGTCTVTGTNYSCTTSGTFSAGTYEITTKATSVGGSISAASSALSVTVDTGGPTFSDPAITSTATNNFYKVGSVISVALTTSEAATLSGSPTVTLIIGTTEKTATYASGSGSTSLVFSYTVLSDDSDSDGVALKVNSLALNGGSIVDAAGNAASLDNPAISDSSSHKVDGRSPTVSSFTLSGSGYYNAGDTITVTAVFSESVAVTGAVRIPVTGVTNGGSAKTVNLDYDNSLSTGDTKVFVYTVVSGDLDLNGIDIAANAIDLNGGSILDPAGNSATITYSAQAPPATPIIDAVLPTVTAFGSSKSTGTYKAGETISLTATISETVSSGASLTVRLSTGADVVLTNASSGTTLSGTYTVSASDSSTVLSVVSFVITTAPTDVAGNALTSTTVPDTNIPSGINIDVDGPLITGPSGSAGDDAATKSLNENLTAVHTFTANETVTWAVVTAANGGGSDASKFSINSSGALVFTSAPNFENPTDAEDTAGNNTYVVKIRATDVAGNVDTQTVTISILNVVDSATVTSLTVTSSSGSDNAYTVGEIIELTAVFSEAVTLDPSTSPADYPRIELQGLASKFATYVSGSGTTSLIFRYTVAGGDTDQDGFTVLANSIELDTKTLRNADAQDTNLDHSAITAVSSNKIDAVAPLLATTTPSDNATGVALDANITMTFTKAVIKNTGNVTIYRTDATPAAVFEQIPIGDSRITLSLDSLTMTINPTGTFSNSVGYYVLVDSTALKDASGNNFAGISNANSFNFNARSTIAITTPSTGLTAFLNLAYSLTVTSTSGTGTKTFALDTGTLPAGLTLDGATGIISGTATTAGSSAIKIKVTDGSGTTAVSNSFTITVSTPTFRQFDNGKIRIGSSSGENSVNNKGNFQQPWYKSGANYFKLTFSSYSLNFSFGQGTTNASYFNGNTLPLTQDPTMTSQVIDYSGFVGTVSVGSGIRGYGTIISTGTFALGGVTYQLKNTFVLGQTSSSIRVSTEFTNTSTTATGQNLTFWVGTQDDWVGSTDRPTKTKGNLVNGAFVPTTSLTAQARALQITSGSEAVMFFSTHPNVNTASNSCCSFTNTTSRDPKTSPLAQTNDGSYAMYVPFGDMGPSTTTSFTWYYAAGPSSELTTVIADLSALGSDTTAPTITGVNFASNAGSDSTYKIGDSIDVNVAFSETVNVTGSPRIPIVGLSGKFFTYVSGSGSSTLTFRYVVASSDLDNDGLSIDANSLALNSGNIGDAAGNNAVITHLAIATQPSHKVDGVAPTVSTLTPTDGATGVPVNANIEITFSEAISIGTGNIYIKKVLSGTGTTVEQIPVNGSRVTISGSTITVNPDANLESLSDYAIGIDATAITDAAGNAFAGITDNTTFNFTSANASSPTVVRVTSDYTNGSYGNTTGGNQTTIPIKIVFSKNVFVTLGSGKPMLTLSTGTTPNAVANYVSGSGTTTLTFDYVVAIGESSADLDYVSVDALILGTGATIKDAAGSDATLTLPSPGATNSLGANKALVIDTSAPVISTFSPIGGATNVLADSNIVITFNDPMLILASLQITLMKKGSPDTTVETFTHNSSRISLSGQVLTIDPTSALESFSEYFVLISAPGLTDQAGNAFAGISGYAYSFKSENFNPTSPTVGTQPSNVEVTSGRSATFTASGSTTDLGTLSYQWYKGSTPISGATSSSLTISPVTSADAGDYRLVITNTYRGLTATVQTNTVSLTVNASMSISFGASSFTSTYGTSTNSGTPTVTGGTGSKTWSITQTIDSRPVAGISINTSTGVVTVSDSISAGTYDMTVSVSDASSSTSTGPLSIAVQKKTITITGMTASNRGFDTSTRATLNFTAASLVGVLTADATGVAIVSSAAVGNFATAAVGTGKTVTASGVSLSGPYADNYNLTQPTATADITKGSQTITITSVTPSKPLPGRSYTPSATSNSLLAVTFTVSLDSASVCELVAGQVNFLASGTCRVNFNQAGDASWEPATQATQALIIGKLGQNITFGALSSKSYGDSVFQVSASSSSGLVITLSTDSNSDICTVSSIGIVKVIGVGSCRLTATQNGNDAYSEATPVSQSFLINPIVPTAPRISSLNPGNERVTISWTAPVDNGGASITGYRVISQSPDDKICDTTGALFCTVDALTNGNQYTFTVTATNEAGISPPSSRSTAVTPVTKAAAVESLILVAGDGTLTASWSQPASLGGGAFTKYQLFIRSALGGTYPGTPTTEITNEATGTYQFTGLTNGTAYTVKVVTITSVSSGDLEGDTAEVSQIPAVAPDAPRNLVAIAPTGNSATVTWAVPLSNGGAAITGYTVTANIAGRALTCTTVTSTSCFIETITVGTSLRMGKGLRAAGGWSVVNNSLNVSVVANNLIGSSPPASTTLSLPTAPSAPTITKVEAVNGEIQITYTSPASDGGSAITGYTTTIFKRGSIEIIDTCNSSSLTCGAIVTGNIYDFDFKTIATNPVGQGEVSLIFSPPVPVRGRVFESVKTPSIPVFVGGESPQVAPGQSIVLVGGVAAQSNMKVVDNTFLSISNGSMQILLKSENSLGETQEISKDMILRVTQGKNASIEAIGFKPESSIYIWLLSSTVLLGEFKVSKDGTLKAAFAIPSRLSAGSHTIQVNGLTLSDSVASYTAGIEIIENKVPGIRDLVWKYIDEVLSINWAALDFATTITITKTDKTQSVVKLPKGQNSSIIKLLEPGFMYEVLVAPVGLPAGSAYKFVVDLPPRAPNMVKVYSVEKSTLVINWDGSEGANDYVISIIEIRTNPEIGAPIRTEISKATKETTYSFIANKEYEYEISIYAESKTGKKSEVALTTGVRLSEISTPVPDVSTPVRVKPVSPGTRVLSVFMATGKPVITTSEKNKIKSIARVIKKKTLITCIAYTSTNRPTSAQRKIALSQANKVCSTIKSLNKLVTTKLLVKAKTTAPKVRLSANPKKTQRVDLYKK